MWSESQTVYCLCVSSELLTYLLLLLSYLQSYLPFYVTPLLDNLSFYLSLSYLPFYVTPLLDSFLSFHLSLLSTLCTFIFPFPYQEGKEKLEIIR